MRDTYEATWRAKRMSAAELMVSHKTWEPMLQRWVEQARQNAEYQRREAEQRKIADLVNKLEPVPNWFGPCIVTPEGDIYPVTGSHEGTARVVFEKLLPDEYKQKVATQGFVDALSTLCSRGWVRVSWDGEITDAYRYETPSLTEKQVVALTDMANERDSRIKMGGGYSTFSDYLLESLAKCEGREVEEPVEEYAF